MALRLYHHSARPAASSPESGAACSSIRLRRVRYASAPANRLFLITAWTPQLPSTASRDSRSWCDDLRQARALTKAGAQPVEGCRHDEVLPHASW